MKTLFDKSVRDGMTLSHKLMLACLACFAATLFFPYSYGTGSNVGGYGMGSVTILTSNSRYVEAGTGWELAPLAMPVMLVLFVLYLGDPDENVPFFRHVGWWLTPFVPFLTVTVNGYEAPALLIGLLFLFGMLVAAGLHFFEQRSSTKKAASVVPPAAPKP